MKHEKKKTKKIPSNLPKPLANPNKHIAEIFERTDAHGLLFNGQCPNCATKMEINDVVVAKDAPAAAFVDLVCPRCKLSITCGNKSPLFKRIKYFD